MISEKNAKEKNIDVKREDVQRAITKWLQWNVENKIDYYQMFTNESF